MKNKLTLSMASLIILIGLMIQTSLAGAAVTHSIQKTNQQSSAVAGISGISSDYNCSAYTTCANGAVISCWSSGSASCNWSYDAGEDVFCEGWGTDGSYSWYRQTCN